MIHIQSADSAHINAMTSLIERLNNLPHHHVGYCGNEWQEINHTLLELHQENSQLLHTYTALAYQDQQLMGLLLLDADDEAQQAECWGPFIECEDESWFDIADLLWQHIQNQKELQVKRVLGFYNTDHSSALQWAATKQAHFAQHQHIILSCSFRESENNEYDDHSQQTEFSLIQEVQSAAGLTSAARLAFEQLHEQNFPGSYYNGKQILARLTEENRLWLYEIEGQLCGYVYTESDSRFNEGTIEYIAVDDQYRGKRIGTRLLKHALNYLHYEIKVQNITLCVNAANQAAVHLYISCGFSADRQLQALHWNI